VSSGSLDSKIKLCRYSYLSYTCKMVDTKIFNLVLILT